MSGHRIDWARGLCVRCGNSHDIALDHADCIEPIFAKLIDAIPVASAHSGLTNAPNVTEADVREGSSQ